MKIFHPRRVPYLQGKWRYEDIREGLAPIQKGFDRFRTSIKVSGFKPIIDWFKLNVPIFYARVKSLGITPLIDDYEKSKLAIFNQLNLFQIIIGLMVPILIIFDNKKVAPVSGLLACGPAFASLMVLALNAYRKYDLALILYFTLHPFFTSIIYMSGMDLGIELYFILYGILSVFFLKDIGHMLLSLSFSMMNYFMLSVVLTNYQFQLGTYSMFFYLFNELLALVFIFYGLFLIKKENASYHNRIVHKNIQLQIVNAEIEKQKKELTELNLLKNKLFSVISHDLKTPIYALHNLFHNMQKQNIPAREIKALIPEVVNDVSYTMSLMENLLHWAKSQMSSNTVRPIVIDVASVISEIINLFRLQADNKKIALECKNAGPVYVYADKDMLNIVLRNLISNAIKFTPESGTVFIGINESSSFVEVYVQDTGTGMSPEILQKVNAGNYFTTKGTGNEAGTGLGLMLCKEFLVKNGGQMYIESVPGEGSLFSFTLPVAAA